MRFINSHQLWALLIPVLTLPGCITLTSSEPPPAIYVLHPAMPQPQDVAQPGVLEIEKPDVPAGFDNNRIALYLDNGRRLDYFASARWPAPLDELLQDFLAQSAQRSFPGLTVTAADSDLPAHYRLVVKVIEFQPVYPDGPTGVPGLYAALKFTLVSLPDEKILADFTIADHRQSSSNDLTAITSGLESLLQTITGQAFQRLAPAMQPPR